VLAYTPGASGDFLCCNIWKQGDHWAKTVELQDTIEDRVLFGPTPVNSYGFKNTLKYVGINDKPLSIDTKDIGQILEITDDRYDVAPKTKLKSLSDDKLDTIWNAIEEKLENKNLLSSVHIPKFEYPWPNKTKFVKLKVGPESKNLVDAFRVVKSSQLGWMNENQKFMKYETDDSDVLKQFDSGKIPLKAQEFFKKRGWVTRWELEEIQYHGYNYYQNDPLPIPNPKIWIENKLKIFLDDNLVGADAEINLDKLYNHNMDELEKLFNEFDIKEVSGDTIKEIWKYFDCNVKMYSEWNNLGNGDWKNYVINQINEGIEIGGWIRNLTHFISPEIHKNHTGSTAHWWTKKDTSTLSKSESTTKWWTNQNTSTFLKTGSTSHWWKSKDK
jgi:hypothetical protein